MNSGLSCHDVRALEHHDLAAVDVADAVDELVDQHPVAGRCSVFSIEPDGMKNAWTRNVLMSSASTSAMRIRNGSSRQNDQRFLAAGRLSARRGRRAAGACVGGPASRRSSRRSVDGRVIARVRGHGGARGAGVSAPGSASRFSLIFAFLPRSSRR